MTKKPQKIYSIYVEILARGPDEEEVIGVVEDELDEIFGATNYRTHTIQELTEDEAIEFDSGVYDEGLRDSAVLEEED